MSTLSLKNINKIYDNNVQAVFDFNLEVKDKEFIVLVGPSGCGKSTTLRMIAGLEDITYGELCIDGQIMNDVAPKDRNIAMVFQNYALYPHMTVYKNMAFALKLRKQNLPIFEPDPAVDELVAEMDEVYKQIKIVDKKYKKDQNNNDLLQQHIKLYEKVFAINSKIEKIRKPLVGTDLLTINELNKKISNLNKEISSMQARIDSGNCSENEETAMCEGIAQRNKLIEKYTESVEYYQTHDSVILKSRHLNAREIDIEINKTAASIDLTRYLFRKPSALSGGQRQRVALGRAIVRKPKVFLMDEPLSNLDAKLRVQTRSEISKLHKRVGATTIYVTHDQTEAMTMADRIVIMKDGYVQQVGTPDEVYNDPANKFVAGFIGSPAMNFIFGLIDKESFVLKNSKNSLGLPTEVVGACKGNKNIILGVRPEDIYVKDDANNLNPSKPIKVKVTYVELLGSTLIVYADLEGQNILFEAKSLTNIKVDDVIEICIDSSKMYFFDGEKETRIK